ncbi:MAG: tetratricopeptide repeat protein [Candidatus Altiarchaeota archaeon]
MQSFDYHNSGNEYYRKGEYKKAVESYNTALKESGVLETYFNRGLAYTRLEEYDKAVEDMESVLGLNPEVGEAYYTIGLIQEYKKKPNKALKYYKKALSVNQKYEKARYQSLIVRLQAIRVVVGDRNLINKLKKLKAKAENETLKAHLEDEIRRLDDFISSYERPSCDLNCNLCCYFEDEPWNYAVLIEPKKLDPVKKFLKENNLKFEEYVGKVNYKNLTKEQKGSGIGKKEYRIKDGSGYYLYYLRRDPNKKLGVNLAEDRPVSLNGNDVDWITKDSTLCKFFKGGTCILHNIGSGKKPGLDVCRSWVCLTGCSLILLRKLGIIDTRAVRELDIRRLNKVSEEILTSLYSNLYSNGDLLNLSSERARKLEHALKSESEEGIKEYLQFEEDYKRTFNQAISNVKEALNSNSDAMVS